MGGMELEFEMGDDGGKEIVGGRYEEWKGMYVIY